MVNTVNVFPYYNNNHSSGIDRYLCVVLDTTGESRCKLPVSEGDSGFVGVTVEKTEAVGAIAVQTAGRAKVYASESVSIGDWLKIAGTDGKVKPADNATAVETFVIGRCEKAAGANELCEFLIMPHTRTI